MQLHFYPLSPNCVKVLFGIAADTLTLADVAIASTSMYADAARMPLESSGHVRRWFENVRSTPAWMAAQPITGAA